MRITESSVYSLQGVDRMDPSILSDAMERTRLLCLDCASRTACALHCGIVFLFFFIYRYSVLL